MTAGSVTQARLRALGATIRDRLGSVHTRPRDDQRRKTRGPLAAIVLAAGKGTRMRSARAKVLHELLGRPLVGYPVELARALGADPVVAVLGHQREAVEAALLARFGAGAVTVVEQTEQRGTGHAVRLAMPALARMADGLVLVLYGDVPLLRRETLEELVGTARRYGCLALVTATPPDPTGYGRILRDERGHVIGVVEQKDASPEERAIAEINAGIYCGPADFFREATAGPRHRQRAGRVLPHRHRRARGAQHRRLRDRGRRSATSPGINDRQQLAEAEATLRARINRALHGARHLPRSRQRPSSSPTSRSASTSSWAATSRCAGAPASATARASATAAS